MKALNKKSKEILNKILGKIVPIKALNTRVIKVKYSKNYIRVEKRPLNNHGHIITIATIVRNKGGRYYEIPRISILKLFKDANYYPIGLVDTKKDRSIICTEVLKTIPKKHKCIDFVIQGILTEYVDIHLEVLNNARILD